jgi:Ser-tRNA(Ala) deacylase AlaX
MLQVLDRPGDQNPGRFVAQPPSGIRRARPQVDYERRGRIMPNHTMTHVLNCALRRVLGGDVDQKGSQVSEEKFRFDFSCAKALTADEVEQTEKIINGVIDAQLNVHSKVVPLKEAMAIKGLRAVFGEAYPDPVRVISVGPQVDSLVANPASDSWMEHSIEFCGGTHLENTRDAEACCIVEETAVAKGIRRVSGITGPEAKRAFARAAEMSAQVRALSAAVAGGDSTALDAGVVRLRFVYNFWPFSFLLSPFSFLLLPGPLALTIALASTVQYQTHTTHNTGLTLTRQSSRRPAKARCAASSKRFSASLPASRTGK